MAPNELSELSLELSSGLDGVVGELNSISSKMVELEPQLTAKVKPIALQMSNVCKQIEALANFFGDAIQKLDTKFTAVVDELRMSTDSRNAALDCTINARAASELQRVCELAKQQENHVKLANVELGDHTLNGNIEAKRKIILDATPLEGDQGNAIKVKRIRNLGRPKDGKSVILVECSDLEARQALFTRCKNSSTNVRASPFLPKFLHSVSVKFNDAYRKVPSLKDNYIRIKFNYERKTMTSLRKKPEEPNWSLVETLKIPIPQEFVTSQVKQITKSKFLTDLEISKLVPAGIDL